MTRKSVTKRQQMSIKEAPQTIWTWFRFYLTLMLTVIIAGTVLSLALVRFKATHSLLKMSLSALYQTYVHNQVRAVFLTVLMKRRSCSPKTPMKSFSLQRRISLLSQQILHLSRTGKILNMCSQSSLKIDFSSSTRDIWTESISENGRNLIRNCFATRKRCPKM